MWRKLYCISSGIIAWKVCWYLLASKRWIWYEISHWRTLYCSTLSCSVMLQEGSYFDICAVLLIAYCLFSHSRHCKHCSCDIFMWGEGDRGGTVRLVFGLYFEDYIECSMMLQLLIWNGWNDSIIVIYCFWFYWMWHKSSWETMNLLLMLLCW